MRRLIPTSLRARLALVFGVGTSVVLLLALSLLYVVLDHELAEAVDQDLAARSDDLVAAVRTHDLGAVHGDPMAQLYGADGVPIVTAAAIRGQLLLTPGQVHAVRGSTFGDGTLPPRDTGSPMPLRLLSRPVGSTGQVLTVALPLSAIDRAGARQLIVLAVATPVLIIALAALGWQLLRAALRPVGELTRQAAAISSLDSDRQLPQVPGDDEFARLAATLSGMLARLSVAFERERAFVDDASHELRTPIAVLRGEIDLALAAVDDPAEVRESLIAAQGQVIRLGRLAEDLLLLARERAGTLVVLRTPVDLTDLAHSEAAVLSKVKSLTIETYGDPAPVEADTDRLRQVIGNLAANSAAAGATTARVTVTADRAHVRLQWADDGPGFPPALLDSAFERFVRGDAARSATGGAGLGLSIVRAIVTGHDGTIDIRNGPPLGGAVVSIRLPVGRPGTAGPDRHAPVPTTPPD
ncbi:sensor histidine kinase [Actinoplanes sp. NPDC020271]|uniref:sensor histidine kinase n=1 Tax=Actinoplanes sp. NPDC020271 TaxID=3363896 RepID=UPI0037AF0923